MHPTVTRKHLKALAKVLSFFDEQQQIAKSLGISKAVVNDWFRGRKPISVKQAQRLANQLQNRVTFAELRPDVQKEYENF